MGAWEEIVDYTVPTTTGEVVISNFGTITKDDFVKITVTQVSSVENQVTFLANSSVTSNYHRQGLAAFGSSIVAFRQNNSVITDMLSGSMNYFAYLKLSENDRLNVFLNHNLRNDTDLRKTFIYTTSSGATFPNGITSLTFQSNQTNGLGAGSRIQIYKLAAEKVADITVTSNTTQVDITGLDIKKGDEYLLVSDLLSSNSSGFELYYNNLTTSSGYYNQRIEAFSTTSFSLRENNPRYANALNGARHLSYINVKLSNIGSFTSQTYGIENYGSSDIFLSNFFTSSVAENITSISQLNVRSQSSNAIGTGTRFQLYKLYQGGN